MNRNVTDWGFALDGNGGLQIGGASAEALARAHGTPLHLIDEGGLRRRAVGFRAAFERSYAGRVQVHYASEVQQHPRDRGDGARGRARPRGRHAL